MANVIRFSSVIPVKNGKAIISLGNLDTQFITGPAAVTNLTANADKLSLTLDAPIGSTVPLGQPGPYQAIGYSILAGQTLNTGAGDDSLDVLQGNAAGAIGINIGLGGTLDMGAGKDSFRVTLTGLGSIGVNNQGKLLTGAGIEILKAEGDLHGLVNGSVTNTAAVFDTGAGADKFVASSATGHAIENYGTIIMGLDTEAESDVLTGNTGGHPLIPPAPAYTPGLFGIYNTGVIRMGGGRDTIDASVGGFGGGGTYLLGWTKVAANGAITKDTDADSVTGFGWGTFDGGGGRNGITLPDGTYKINYTTTPVGLTDLASGSIQRSGDGGLTWDVNPGTTDVTLMTFKGFDGIGGAGLNAGLHFIAANPLNPATNLILQSFTVNTAGDVVATTYV
jgi:hypothetical protein